MIEKLKTPVKRILTFTIALMFVLSSITVASEAQEQTSMFIKSKGSEFLKIEMEKAINSSFEIYEDTRRGFWFCKNISDSLCLIIVSKEQKFIIFTKI